MIKKSETDQLCSNRQLHILAVDDCIQDLQVLLSILKQDGHKISVAFDGKQAYERARLRKPDVILMDIRMPRMCGLTAATVLQGDDTTSGIPIIFLSVVGDTQSRIEGLSRGAIDYVTKPFDAQEVMARIRAAVRWRKYADQPPVENSPLLSEHERLVHATQLFVQNHIHKIPNVDKLAKRMGTYKKRLNIAFLEVTKESVAFNLTGLRIEKAKDYLKNTNLSITTIAEELGYSSGANFASAFHHRVGMSPSRFRTIERSTT